MANMKQKKRSSVPPNYTCFKCKEIGDHWIMDCGSMKKPNRKQLVAQIYRSLTERRVYVAPKSKPKIINSIRSTVCDKDAMCDRMGTFLSKMRMYNPRENHQAMGHFSNIHQLLDDYLHLMNQHTQDKQFETIANGLGDCAISKCKMFIRTFRNRNTETVSSNLDLQDTVYYDVIAKIHCYFQHSCDMGNRLSISEKSNIGEDKSEKLVKMYEILSPKQKLSSKLCHGLNNRMQHKYNQISQISKRYDMYHWGLEFNYGIDLPKIPGKRNVECCEGKVNSGQIVSAKYASLKDELINNDLATLTREQFGSEYMKSKMHFHSEYCRSHYRPLTWRYPEYEKATRIWTQELMMELDYILSLMIYCNYDRLQYIFSATYRDNGKKHCMFYHLGKSLKIAVRELGTPVAMSSICTLYHGISKTLYFPSYIQKVIVNCPLSTTSSIEVAINFANNEGLVIEFGIDRYREPQGVSLKFFDVSWLSDYSNEREHLFIQNNTELIIHNILEVEPGYEYHYFLQAFGYFERILLGRELTDMETTIEILMKGIISDQLSQKLSNYKEFKMSRYARQMCTVYCENVKCIVAHVCEFISTSLSLSPINNWIGFDEMFIMFPNVETLIIEKVKLSASAMNCILKCLQKQKVEGKLKLCSMNVDKFMLDATSMDLTDYIKLHSKTDDYLTKAMGKSLNKGLDDSNDSHLSIHSIHFNDSNDSTDSNDTNDSITIAMRRAYEKEELPKVIRTYAKEELKEVMRTYAKTCREMEMFMYIQVNLHVDIDFNPYQFATNVFIHELDHLNGLLQMQSTSHEFIDAENEIKDSFFHLIEQKLNGEPNNEDEKEFEYYHQFNEYCKTKTQQTVSWNMFPNYRTHLKDNGENDLSWRIFNLFTHSKYECINLDSLIIFFPNIEEVSMMKINLCPWIMNYILSFLKTNKTTISLIKLRQIKNDSPINAWYAVKNYCQQFNDIGYKIRIDFGDIWISQSKQVEFETTV
eukprot:440601_1